MAMAESDAKEDLTSMLRDAIMALQAANASGRDATSRIEQEANDPELKELLQQGSRYSESWRERLARVAEQVGGSAVAGEGNPVIDAIQQVGGKIIKTTHEPMARDLGIIASGQLALHYYIAAFGTTAAYANLLGEQDVAATIHECLQEAKQGDERYTELAAKLGK